MSSVAPSKRALDYGFISTYLPQKVGVYYYLPDYRSRESAITVWRTPAEDYLPVGQMFSTSRLAVYRQCASLTVSGMS